MSSVRALITLGTSGIGPSALSLFSNPETRPSVRLIWFSSSREALALKSGMNALKIVGLVRLSGTGLQRFSPCHCIHATTQTKHALTSWCRGQPVLWCCYACCWHRSAWEAVGQRCCRHLWTAGAAGWPELPASAAPEPSEPWQLPIRDKHRYVRHLHS